jgi:hypothetical protein
MIAANFILRPSSFNARRGETMTKSAQIALMILLVVAAFVTSACGASGGSASGPEATARAYIDAVNARDKDKFIGLWSPDNRDAALSVYDFYVTFERKFPTVKSIVSRDFNATVKEVTAVVEEESRMGKRDVTIKIGMVQSDSRWLVISAINQ